MRTDSRSGPNVGSECTKAGLSVRRFSVCYEVVYRCPGGPVNTKGCKGLEPTADRAAGENGTLVSWKRMERHPAIGNTVGNSHDTVLSLLQSRRELNKVLGGMN